MGVNATMGGTKDYGLKVFPQETMDKIAEEFCNYFKRKNGARLTYEDAKKLVDFVSGPVPAQTATGGVDYSRTVVTGGGETRPTEEEIGTMLSKYEPREVTDEWDGVFDELLELYEEHPWARKLIYMTFRDNENLFDIYQTMTDITGEDFGKDKYYRERKTILTQVGILAYHVGLIDMTPYSSCKLAVAN